MSEDLIECQRRCRELQVEHDGLRRSEREWRIKQVAAERALTVAQARIAEVERERDEARATINSVQINHAALRKLVARLRQDRDVAQARIEQALREAADEIEAWGAYADSYFQDKHDLEGTVQRFRALAALSPDRQTPEGGEAAGPLTGPGAKPLSRMSWSEMQQIYPRDEGGEE